MHTPTQFNLSNQIATTWQGLVNAVAHDFKTPLASINIGVQLLEKILPDLIKGYSLAVSHQLMEGTLDKRRLKMIEENSLKNMDADIHHLFDFLSVLYDYTKTLTSELNNEKTFSVNKTLTDLLKKYAYSVNLNLPKEITFTFSPLFMEYAIFNILNCFDKTTRVDIWIKETENNDVLHLKITADDVHESQLRHALEHYFVRHDHKVIPGLGLCQLAFLQHNAHITLQNLSKQSAEFAITLPK